MQTNHDETIDGAVESIDSSRRQSRAYKPVPQIKRVLTSIEGAGKFGFQTLPTPIFFLLLVEKVFCFSCFD
jgi:hypothetical protein